MSLLQEERNIIVQNKYADNFDFAEIEDVYSGVITEEELDILITCTRSE